MDPERLRALAHISAEPLTREAFVSVLASLAEATSVRSSQIQVADGTSQEIFRSESRFLGIFAVDYTLADLVGAPNLTKPILDDYYQRVGLTASERTAYLSRRETYSSAIRTPHQNGPGWQLGDTFAALCGRENDFGIRMRAYSMFMAAYQAVSEFIIDASNPGSASAT